MMTTLSDLMTKTDSNGEPKKRYRDYVIEAQEKGEAPLPFAEWYKLNQ